MLLKRLVISNCFSTSARSHEKMNAKDLAKRFKQFCSLKPFRHCLTPNYGCVLRGCLQKGWFMRMSEHFQRARRGRWLFYKHYNQFSGRKVVLSLFKKFQPSRQMVTFAAAACTFSWEENGFSNMEIQEHVEELSLLEKVQSDGSNWFPNQTEYTSIPKEWENVLDEPNLKIWRLPSKKTGFMQYKVFGRFTDISAYQFFTVQTDLDYRRKWDNLVIDISIVDENTTTGEQVLRWVSYFPYPFNAREYVYIRRTAIYEKENIMVLLAKSVDHPKCITPKNHVRVPLYISEMVIKPHKAMDEPGLDYLLTYCDDPQTVIPSRLKNWVVTAGIPEYIEKLHKASRDVGKLANENINLNSTAPSSDRQIYTLQPRIEETIVT